MALTTQMDYAVEMIADAANTTMPGKPIVVAVEALHPGAGRRYFEKKLMNSVPYSDNITAMITKRPENDEMLQRNLQGLKLVIYDAGIVGGCSKELTTKALDRAGLDLTLQTLVFNTVMARGLRTASKGYDLVVLNYFKTGEGVYVPVQRDNGHDDSELAIEL